MKLRISVFIRIMAPLVLLIVLTVGISGYRVYRATTERWQSEMDTRLERVAMLIAQQVDPALLEQVRQPTDLGNAAYLQIQQTLNTALTAGNLNWIGIYYSQGGYLYYWVDTSDSGVGYPFFYATPAHFAALQDGQPHRVAYTDEFGSYYGFVAPIVVRDESAQPQTIGLVEAVLDGESAQLLQRNSLNQVLPTLIGGMLVAIGVATLITMLAFQRPLQHLKRGALALANGEFEHTILLHSNDELGDLAITFNQMAVQLASLYGKLKTTNRLLEERVAARTAELVDERNRLDTILQNIADGLVVTDPDGNIGLVNPAFEQIARATAAELHGRPLREVLPAGELCALVERALNHPGTVYTVTFSTPNTEGSLPAFYKTSACAVLHTEQDGRASVMGVVTILRDVTREAEVDRMKTEFISTVSHELRTPLTSVLGFAKLISRTLERDIAPHLVDDNGRAQPAVERIRDNLEIIITEGERLTRLINDVLDIAKMEAGKVEWHMADISIAEVIRSAVSTISSLARAKGLKVKVTLADLLPLVHADRDRLVQVVTNLLSNAVKFTDQGGIQVNAFTVEVLPDGTQVPPLTGVDQPLPTGTWLAISVQDTGVGIPPDKLSVVFQKFTQLGDIMTNRPKGTGLGLAICKEIVEHHGGRIWAVSEPGRGSTFIFVLPLIAAKVTVVTVEELRRRVAETLPEVGSSNLILVVDDDASIRNLLSQELAEAGYQVMEAENGMEALAVARRERPALIILDLMMPGISGFDVLSALKSDPATSPIPVLILSVLEDQERGLRLGADGYLTKPLDSERMLETVAGLLARAARGEGRKKVLVIDEDASVIASISQVLEERGYEVVAAHDAASGLERARQERPDLVILDSVISTMDNYAVLRALKTGAGARDVYVIVMTTTTVPAELTGLLSPEA